MAMFSWPRAPQCNLAMMITWSCNIWPKSLHIDARSTVSQKDIFMKVTRSFCFHQKHQQTQRMCGWRKVLFSPKLSFAVLIAAKLLKKQNSESKRALYGSAIFVFHFGAPIWRAKLPARRKRDFATQIIHCYLEWFSYHFLLISISEKHFKSEELLVSVTFQFTLSKAVSYFETLNL